MSIVSALRKRFRAVKITGGLPEWLTVNEAAAYLKVHRTTIYDLINQGTLPFHELRGIRGRRFKREDLDALLEEPRKEGTDDGSGTPRTR